ncbi:MAG: hypothetical protein ACOC2C_01260 [Cyclonatronaceae bacterium]
MMHLPSSSDFSLSVDLFTQVSEDFEKRQYLVLGSLKKARDAFEKQHLYPQLGQLVELYHHLQKILAGFEGMKQHGPQRIRSIDLQRGRIEFESALPEELDLEAVKELVRWAQPLINEAIQQGIEVYEFVDKKLSLDEVGIRPGYADEGYFFMPNTETGALQLFRYEMSIYTGAGERFRSLKTRLVKSLAQGKLAQAEPGALKMQLIREYPELPNPATFCFHTGLNAPFGATLFPIAKRKLMRYLSALR